MYCTDTVLCYYGISVCIKTVTENFTRKQKLTLLRFWRVENSVNVILPPQLFLTEQKTFYVKVELDPELLTLRKEKAFVEVFVAPIDGMAAKLVLGAEINPIDLIAHEIFHLGYEIARLYMRQGEKNEEEFAADKSEAGAIITETLFTQIIFVPNPDKEHS